ncbi:hypothetical protein [Nonomuraea sp. KM90]|uniref:hypothetical protein n=1 Tax=Nonomuraea sp. KM90 TaxID=3457428 RepID=UPI003FCDC5F0
MSGLTLARLRRLASAAGGRERRLTVVSGPDGRRWAAWSYGCAELGVPLWRELCWPVDGAYELRGDTLTPVQAEQSFGPELVRREMLPLLAATDRTNVYATRWFYEDGTLMRRLLERSDGQRVVVDAQLLQAWSRGGPGYQVGGPNGILVWAIDGMPAVAGLLPVRTEGMPPLPEVAA